MADYCVYHEIKERVRCPDGFASAFIVNLAHPGVNLIPWRYDMPGSPQFTTGEAVGGAVPKGHATRTHHVWVVDFSFPLSVLNEWADKGVQVVVIDHHERAMNDIKDFSRGVLKFNNLKSGATLCWEYFFPGIECPLWIQYVQDHDLFDFALPNSEEVAQGMAAEGRNFENYAVWTQEGQAAIDRLIELGKPILEPRNQLVKQIVETGAETVNLAGHRIHIVELEPEHEYLRCEAPPTASHICAAMYRGLFKEDEFVATIRKSDTHCNFENWDLRSNKHGSNFDCAEIAASLGGGGHRNASGFIKLREEMDFDDIDLELMAWLSPEDYGKGEAKTWDELVNEVYGNECYLCISRGELLRSVNLVCIDVLDELGNCLIEDRQEFADGRIRKRGIRGLSEKIFSYELLEHAVNRTIEEELVIGIANSLDSTGIATPEEVDELMYEILSFNKANNKGGIQAIGKDFLEKESQSYPGLKSRYNRHHYQIVMPDKYRKDKYKEIQSTKTTYYYWIKKNA